MHISKTLTKLYAGMKVILLWTLTKYDNYLGEYICKNGTSIDGIFNASIWG